MLSSELGQDLPLVSASGAQLRQILLNLITNGSDAIGDRGGVIRVVTRRGNHLRESAAALEMLREGDYLCLEVSDTGCGMSLETQARVFDPFLTTKAIGRGLGLAAVSGIVRDLGGEIHLASELGEGTTFQLFLPTAKTTGAATSDALPVLDELSVPSTKPVVLVVEDEDALRQAVVKILHKTGLEVFEAPDGSTAINLLRANSPNIDVILLDMTIPGVSSEDVVTEATNLRPDIRVVLTSAYGEERFSEAVRVPQITSLIRKPFRFVDLVNIRPPASEDFEAGRGHAKLRADRRSKT